MTSSTQYLEDMADFLTDSVKIDPLDLNREFVEFPARLAYWNNNLADATDRYLTAKADYETAKAAARVRLRSSTLTIGKAPTREDIDAMVVLDDDVRSAQEVFMKADVDRTRVRGIVEALCAKRDMLQSLGAKIRAEMHSDPALRAQMAGGSALDFGAND